MVATKVLRHTIASQSGIMAALASRTIGCIRQCERLQTTAAFAVGGLLTADVVQLLPQWEEVVLHAAICPKTRQLSMVCLRARFSILCQTLQNRITRRLGKQKTVYVWL